MNITVNPKVLREALSELVPFGSTKKKGELGLTGRIIAGNNSVVIYTGDFQKQFYAQREIPAVVNMPGQAGIDINQAMNALSIFDADVKIDMPRDGDSGTIQFKHDVVPLRGSAETIYKIDPSDTPWLFVEKAEKLITAAAIVNKCRRQDDDARYAINGICFLPTKDGMELAGTDGKVYVAVRTGLDKIGETPAICQPELSAALSSYDKKKELWLKIEDKRIWVKQEGNINVVGRIDGTYPDYHKVIDTAPVRLGDISSNSYTKVIQAISKKILEPNHQGQIRILGDGVNLILTNRSGAYKLSLPVPGFNLQPSACTADRIARAFSLFDGIVSISSGSMPTNKNKRHLYLQQNDRFVMLLLEDDYLGGSL